MQQGNKKEINNIEVIKKTAKKCYRCGEWFVTDVVKQNFCPTCRGLTGAIKPSNWQEQVTHGFFVGDILKDYRR